MWVPRIFANVVRVKWNSRLDSFYPLSSNVWAKVILPQVFILLLMIQCWLLPYDQNKYILITRKSLITILSARCLKNLICCSNACPQHEGLLRWVANSLSTLFHFLFVRTRQTARCISCWNQKPRAEGEEVAASPTGPQWCLWAWCWLWLSCGSHSCLPHTPVTCLM